MPWNRRPACCAGRTSTWPGRAAAVHRDVHDQVRGAPLDNRRQAVLHFVNQIEVVDHGLIRTHIQVPFDNNGIRLLTDEGKAGAQATTGDRPRSLIRRSFPQIVQDGPLREAGSDSPATLPPSGYPGESSRVLLHPHRNRTGGLQLSRLPAAGYSQRGLDITGHPSSRTRFLGRPSSNLSSGCLHPRFRSN